MNLRAALTLACLIGMSPLPLHAAPINTAGVDLALVMAVDVSESVDAQEYELQHEGIARAFESQAVQGAIQGGSHGAIEATIIEWSDNDKQIITVPWMRISDEASAKAFAAKVRASKRSSAGLTDIGDALLAAAAALKTAPDKATRQVIDLSGDGMANLGPKPADVRDLLTARGITINALAILKTEPWLSGYYNENVIGGTGAFLLEANDFPAFIQAIQEKLAGEIAGLSPPQNASARRWARPMLPSKSDFAQMQ